MSWWRRRHLRSLTATAVLLAVDDLSALCIGARCLRGGSIGGARGPPAVIGPTNRTPPRSDGGNFSGGSSMYWLHVSVIVGAAARP